MGDQRNRALTEHRELPLPTWGGAPGYGIVAFQANMPESLRRPTHEERFTYPPGSDIPDSGGLVREDRER